MMKRYLSVFGLAARSSFWQGLALMIVFGGPWRVPCFI